MSPYLWKANPATPFLFFTFYLSYLSFIVFFLSFVFLGDVDIDFPFAFVAFSLYGTLFWTALSKLRHTLLNLKLSIVSYEIFLTVFFLVSVLIIGYSFITALFSTTDVARFYGYSGLSGDLNRNYFPIALFSILSIQVLAF